MLRFRLTFGISAVALAALVMLAMPPNPAHATGKDALYTLTNYSYPADLFSLAEFDVSMPAVIDRHDTSHPGHDALPGTFGIGHYGLTESLRHDALAFALVGTASDAPEVASPPSIV